MSAVRKIAGIVKSMNDMGINGTRLVDVKTVASGLNHLANGRDLVELAQRSGMWTTELQSQNWERPRFPRNLGNLGPIELSDNFALWTSEFGRLAELLGHLNAHHDSLKVQAKAARAGARGRLRRKIIAEIEAEEVAALAAESSGKKKVVKKPKTVTASAINDEAEEDPAVETADAALNSLETLISIVSSAKEATTMYIQTISREMSYRETQAKQRF